MIISEIFASIDGEGIRAGQLATFVRVAGCPLRCSYCDTQYAQNDMSGTGMSLQEIVGRVASIGYKNVTVTGGEPLSHKNDVLPLIRELAERGYSVNVETNGAEDIEALCKMNNVIVTMDYKTPCSGMMSRMKDGNLTQLRVGDVLKIVMARSDFDWCRNFLKSVKTDAHIFLSPVFGKVEPAQLVDFLKELHKEGVNTDRIRLQLQIHKIIWEPSKRGV